MSLHFTINVNHEPIGAFYARRVAGGTRPNDINTYRVELRDDSVCETRTAHVEHRYGDGAIDLIIAALSELRRPADQSCGTCGSDASTERCCGTTLDDERIQER